MAVGPPTLALNTSAQKWHKSLLIFQWPEQVTWSLLTSGGLQCSPALNPERQRATVFMGSLKGYQGTLVHEIETKKSIWGCGRD